MEKETIFEFEVKKYLTKVVKDNCSWPETGSINIKDAHDPFADLQYIPKNGRNIYGVRWELDYADTTEEVFKKNYGNPFAAVQMKKLSLFVKKSDDKLTLIYFFSTRNRDTNVKYFKILKYAYFVTYNYKTHDVYCGSLTNYHKKRKCVKSIKRNYFADEPFNRFRVLFLHYYADFYTDQKNPKSGSEILAEAYDIFKSNIPGYTTDQPIDLDKLTYFNYLKRKGIKYPNNWFIFSKMFPLAKKKELESSDYKLVDIFMKRNKLKGDRIRKILHKVKGFPNTHSFNFATTLFGYDFVIQKPDEDVTRLFEFPDENGFYFDGWDLPNFSKKEKTNIYGVFKLLFDSKVLDFNTFMDHIRYYNKLNKYEPVQWKSNDLKSFNEEHLDWSDKVEFYSNNKIVRIFDDIVVNVFEQPIEDESGLYQPKVLIKSSDYNEESSFQNHCVKTYSKSCMSLIVSVRKGGERGTLEFRIQKTEEKHLTLNRVQTRGRFNQNLPDYWDNVLKVIDERAKQINRSKLFKTNELDVFLSNGQTKRLKPKVTYLGYLDWDENINDNNHIEHELNF